MNSTRQWGDARTGADPGTGTGSRTRIAQPAREGLAKRTRPTVGPGLQTRGSAGGGCNGSCSIVHASAGTHVEDVGTALVPAHRRKWVGLLPRSSEGFLLASRIVWLSQVERRCDGVVPTHNTARARLGTKCSRKHVGELLWRDRPPDRY